MRFLSVCSGIEAASVAWNPIGWKAWAFSEIEPFPCSVLAHHYPDTPNLGDMTKFKDWPDGSVDLLCGGTPCQSFSAAGLRAGLDDPRGQLMLTFGAIAARYRPRWLVWENVPGVLSSNGGRDFGAFLGLLGHLGYGFAYRVLDAQFVRVDGYARAVPQRRQRVFVVGCLGDWRSAAAVLLERESLRGDSAPRREAGARIAPCLDGGPDIGGDGSRVGRLVAADTAPTIDASYGRLQGASGQDANHGHSHLVSLCLNAKGGGGRLDAESETLIPTTGGGFDVAHGVDFQNVADTGDVCGTLMGEAQKKGGQAGHGVLAFDTTQLTSAANRSNPKPGDPCHPLAAGAHAPAIAFNARQDPINGPINGPIDTNGATNGVAVAAAVRRLMPVECERLQGFPDGYTAVMHRGKPAADGPRYKALGNSWAIPPVRWIGLRIAMVDGIVAELRRAA